MSAILEYPFSKIPSRTHLLIIDDYFPDLRTGFRIAEFHHLIDAYQNVTILSKAVKKKGVFRRFSFVYNEYSRKYIEYSKNVFKYNPLRKISADVAYIIFLQNIYNYVEFIEKNKIRFIFTLYPGGGFLLGEESSDLRLQRVFSSPLFSGVIVTQPITKKYLLDKAFCQEEQIYYSFGLVVDPKRFIRENRGRDNSLKKSICFVAFKYTPDGRDKGFDHFVEVCMKLNEEDSEFSFHVVGNFFETDVENEKLKKIIKFYGLLDGDSLQEFFYNMDIIVSPNRPFILAPGAFDGFPTGCCVEAALCGVAVFCADPLSQNLDFVDGVDLVILDDNPSMSARKIIDYCGDVELLNSLKVNGQQKCKQLYDLVKQMEPRHRAIMDALTDINEES